MKKLVKKIFGIDKLEAATQAAEAKLAEVEQKTKIVEEYAKVAQLSEKERRTAAQQPWVDCDLVVDKENPKYGYFELDWNEYHVTDLKNKGYTGNNDIEVVNQWFNDICRNSAEQEGIDMGRRSSGFINVNNLGNGKTEVS
jgi:hypothetical protein